MCWNDFLLARLLSRNSIIEDRTPLPPPTPISEEDAELFSQEPWVCAPIHADYGCNLKVGPGVFLNFNTTFVDTCPIIIGARTLVGPNCSFYSGTHPLDPALRNGTAGPELGKEIHIGEDCWFGGNVIVLPGVTIGKGSSIGAGSVVTKVSAYPAPQCISFKRFSDMVQDVPPFHVVAGNPARVLRKIETAMDPDQARVTRVPASKSGAEGAEVPMAHAAE